jgi:hypothetical protein
VELQEPREEELVEVEKEAKKPSNMDQLSAFLFIYLFSLRIQLYSKQGPTLSICSLAMKHNKQSCFLIDCGCLRLKAMYHLVA